MKKLQTVKKNVKKILYAVLILLFLYLIKTLDIEEIRESLKNIDLRFFAAALALQLASVVLVNIQWLNIVRWTGRKPKFIDMFKVNCIGNIVDSLTPGVKLGGEIARIYRMETVLKTGKAESAAITAMQKTVSLFSFLTITIISTIILFLDKWNQMEEYRTAVILAVFMSFVFLIFIMTAFFRPDKMLAAVNRFIRSEKLRKSINKGIENYIEISGKLFEDKFKFIKQIILGFLIWILFAVKLYIVVRGFGLYISFEDAFPVTYITYAIGMIPMLPGSIGSFEASMTFLLSLSSISVYEGVMISMVFRFITFWFEFIISGLYLFADKLIKTIISDKIDGVYCLKKKF